MFAHAIFFVTCRQKGMPTQQSAIYSYQIHYKNIPECSICFAGRSALSSPKRPHQLNTYIY